jgi:signal transduction histidine kinase
MSLRTKLMLSIFVFLVLVSGLVTLNLWLDAAVRARAEGRRDLNLVAHMLSDQVRTWTARYPADTDEGRAQLAQQFALSELLVSWTVVEPREDGLQVIISNEQDAERIVREEQAILRSAQKENQFGPDGTRIYTTLQSAQGNRYVARLEVRGVEAPSVEIAGTLKGILTVMALGAALILLNTVLFTNRLVLRPLGSLVEASNRVAAGDFSKKIPESETYDEMGRMIGAFNLMIDRIAHHHRTLQEDIREARVRITDTERKLFAAQRLSTTGTLAAGIAHEINNPLGGMINAVRALREGRLDDAKRAEYLGLIEDGLGRVRSIVQKILELRPRAFEPQPVSLHETVGKAIAFVDHRARRKEVAILNEVPADFAPVMGDPVELQQAILNILMNAVDACVMGEGRVTVNPHAGPGMAGVSVADNGCGMEEEELARCMDPFFTTKDVGEGTGLGLSVAHNIVTNHGGKLEIHTERGRGTTVTLTLPLAGKGEAVAAKTQIPG